MERHGLLQFGQRIEAEPAHAGVDMQRAWIGPPVSGREARPTLKLLGAPDGRL